MLLPITTQACSITPPDVFFRQLIKHIFYKMYAPKPLYYSLSTLYQNHVTESQMEGAFTHTFAVLPRQIFERFY